MSSCVVLSGCGIFSEKPLVSCPGDLEKAKDWEIQASQEGKIVYIPFEGYYENKGGRIQSPKIKLDKATGTSAFYALTFKAKASTPGYWWVDTFDKKGNMLPDINSRIYPGGEFQDYTEVFYAQENVDSVQLAFVSKSGAKVRDVELRKISAAEAAAWCDDLMATLPPGNFNVPADSFAKLPKTQAALNTGKPWRIVLLGDSIVNDTFTSNFQSLVMRDFPNSKVEFINSVRGSTGCWYYQDPAQFNAYVTALKPDLVLIGGISNAIHIKECGDPEKSMISVIEQCRKLGVEIAVMSPPPSYEWRKNPEQTAWDENWAIPPTGFKPLRRDYQQRAVAKTGVAYWDMTTIPCDLIAHSHKPIDWFKRDGAHNNDRGKQLIGRTLAAYFRQAAMPR